jgi:uncharacterized protein (TIGR03083 family)
MTPTATQRLDAVSSWEVALESVAWDPRPLLTAERRALLRLLAGVDASAWASVALPGWSVHDVVSHLLNNDFGRLSAHRDGFAGPDPGADLSYDELVRQIERRNEQWVGATRALSPRLLAELLRFTGRRLDIHLAGSDLAVAGTSVAWTGTGTSPLWLDLAREYTERWVHQQQIRDAVSKPGLKQRGWLRPVFDTFLLALPRSYAAVPAATGTRVVIDIEGRGGGSWTLVRGETRWHLRPSQDAPHDAKVVLPQDTAWRLMAKLIDRDAAHGAIRQSGDRSLTDPVLSATAVMTSAV